MNKLIFVLLSGMIAVASPYAEEPPTPQQPLHSWADFHRFMDDMREQAAVDQAVYEKLSWPDGLTCTQTNYDVRLYDINIRLDDTTGTVDGHIATLADATENGVTQIQVQLAAQLEVDSIVSSWGSLSYSRVEDVILLNLPQAFSQGEQFDYDIYYHGTPVGHAASYPELYVPGLEFQTRQDGRPCISSLAQPHGAHNFWPCKDRLDDKADSLRIRITAAPEFYVATQGRLDSIVAPFPFNLARTFCYTMPHPIVPSYFSLAVSEYAVWEDEWVYNNGLDTMPIINAAFPYMSNLAHDSLAIVPEALGLYSEVFRYDYPYRDTKYGYAAYCWPAPGAWENPTMVSLNGEHWWPYGEYVVIHEMAHSWFGTMMAHASYGDVWISEGWATYAEALFTQYRWGFNQWGRYYDYINSLPHYWDQPVYNLDTLQWPYAYHARVYYDGAYIVHMLRGVLGEELFFEGLHNYFTGPYAFGTLTTEQLADAWTEATGRDLTWFFDQWVFGTYYPTYVWTYLQEPCDSGGYDTHISIDQYQTTDPQVFVMPVDVVFDFPSGPSDTVVFWIDDRRNTYAMHLEDTILNMRFDPAGWMAETIREVNWRLHFIVPDTLPEGRLGVPYDLTFETRGGSGENTFALLNGSLPPGLSLTATQDRLEGIPTDTGHFVFTMSVDDNLSNYYDEQIYHLTVSDFELVPGDINLSGELDIADLIFLVTYMFQSGPPPPLMNMADIDGSCVQDIADLVHLVTYMFREGPPPVIGCVE